MDKKNIKVGDKFAIKFSGAGSIEGVQYQVYDITNTSNYLPSDETLVFLKLISRDGFAKGAKINDCVPVDHLELFYTPVITR